MERFIDIAGQKFGRWTVLEYAGNNKWLCRCDCGTVKEVGGYALRHGRSVSCGCYCKEHHIKKHGESNTKLYRRWRSMRNRCANPKSSSWKNYGGRGIFVCKEWDQDFRAFKEWALANGFEESLTLERIDNDGPYSPENCRFATRKEQACNRRDSRRYQIGTETRVAKEWAENAPVSYDGILSRLNAGWPIEKAISIERVELSRDVRTGRFTRIPI